MLPTRLRLLYGGTGKTFTRQFTYLIRPASQGIIIDSHESETVYVLNNFVLIHQPSQEAGLIKKWWHDIGGHEISKEMLVTDNALMQGKNAVLSFQSALQSGAVFLSQ